MTLVTGTVQDLGYDGMEGTLWARPARFRSDGQVVLAPERKPYKITGGVVSADLAPGPAVLELQVGSHARGTFEVVIPAAAISLADLLDRVFPWEPEQVSQFVAERELAVQAKTAAETAAGQATTAAQQTGQDRAHVDSIRQTLDEAAQSNVAPYLTQSELNATYGTKAEVAAKIDETTAQARYATKADTPSRYPTLWALKDALAQGQSSAIQVLGDSTGNESWEWPTLVAQDLATRYPDFTVHVRTWNDANQALDLPTVVQEGAAGPRHLKVATDRAPQRLDPGSAPHLTGVIDARLKLSMPTWTPANSFGGAILLSEEGGNGAWGWALSIRNQGNLTFYYSSDGSTLQSVHSSAATGLAPGATSWIRVVFDPAGSAKFYLSSDGQTWTQLGTTMTLSPVVLSNRLGDYRLGGHGTVGTEAGVNIYAVDIRDGENGRSIVPRLPDLWSWYGAGTRMDIAGAPVLTVVNGSHPGAGISYLGQQSRLNQLTPDYGQRLTFISTSHNEARAIGGQWGAKLRSFVHQVLELLPGAGVIAVTQNPQVSAATYSREHARRRIDTIGFGKSMGLDVIDTYGMFVGNPNWSGQWMADQVHPNTAGQRAWADMLIEAFDAADNFQ